MGSRKSPPLSNSGPPTHARTRTVCTSSSGTPSSHGRTCPVTWATSTCCRATSRGRCVSGTPCLTTARRQCPPSRSLKLASTRRHRLKQTYKYSHRVCVPRFFLLYVLGKKEGRNYLLTVVSGCTSQTNMAAGFACWFGRGGGGRGCGGGCARECTC